MRLPPIVLAHGCGGSPDAAFVRTGWVSALEQQGRTTVPVDLPGHGAGAQSHDPTDYADMVRAFLPRLPERQFDAVGFSLGAKLLLEIALRHPGRIRRLVLGGLGDNAFAPEAVGETAALALANGPTADTPPPVLAFLDTWEPDRNDALAVAAVLRRPPNPIFTEEQLEALQLPILLVNGSEDPVGRHSTRLVASLRPEAVIRLPGVGHFDLTAQTEFLHAATEFLAATGAQP